MNAYQKKCLKEKFLEEAKRAREDGRAQKYTIEMLEALKDMAKNDVYPDGNFSDMDCNVWSLFRR